MYSNEDPLISIIVAVYNGAGTIQRCIDSVINQTYSNKELIIMDGGSTDGTVEILKANNEKITFWHSEPDNGIANAWNKALKYAKGDWIIFLGADDTLLTPDTLLNVKEYLMRNQKADVVFGKVSLVNEEGIRLKVIGGKWNWSTFRRRMSIPHQGAFHSKFLFDQVGGYDETYKIVSDYELLLRKKRNLKAVYIEQIISNMQAGGLSQTDTPKVFKEWMRAQHQHNVMNAFLIKGNYRYNLFKSRIKSKLKVGNS